MKDDFFTLLRFKTVSANPSYAKEMNLCVKWLMKYLQKMRFKTEIWTTPNNPVLFAENLSAGPDKPTLLLYNHYDVQPSDPDELWLSPPFEPTVREGKIYARGAQDNKGQLFYTLQAAKKTPLPINLKWCIDGGEEVGSPEFAAILPSKKRKLSADYLAIVDLGLPSLKKPALTMGVRGIVALDVNIFGANSDLHSGSHGGIAYNPLHALVEILAKMRKASGRIAIPGFYREVRPLGKAAGKMISFSEFNAREYKRMFRIAATGGEKSFSPYERAWIRPTLEINGLSGGYADKGFKTIIPKEARAKISCRLVPDQDPRKTGKLVADYIRKSLPKGLRTEINIHEGMGRAARSYPDSKAVRAFSRAYNDVLGKPVKYIMEGGSIPIIKKLQKASGAELVLVGLGLAEDNVHAPNECFDFERMEIGTQIMLKAFCYLGES